MRVVFALYGCFQLSVRSIHLIHIHQLAITLQCQTSCLNLYRQGKYTSEQDFLMCAMVFGSRSFGCRGLWGWASVDRTCLFSLSLDKKVILGIWRPGWEPWALCLLGLMCDVLWLFWCLPVMASRDFFQLLVLHWLFFLIRLDVAHLWSP